MTENGAPQLSVATQNIFNGGAERLDGLLALLAARAPDILVLQECLGWSDTTLHRVCQALGVRATSEHAYLGQARPRASGNRYHVGLVSRLALLDARTYSDPATLGHCLVEARVAVPVIGELRVFGTHFDAHDEDLRLREARFLKSLVDGESEGGHRLLLGDLNSLSRRDPYPRELPETVLRAGIDKYGHPPRFDVMDVVEEDWVDLLHARGCPTRWVTAARRRNGVTLDFRTDYVMSSPVLAARLESVGIIDVGALSDHSGVLAVFQLGE